MSTSTKKSVREFQQANRQLGNALDHHTSSGIRYNANQNLPSGKHTSIPMCTSLLGMYRLLSSLELPRSRFGLAGCQFHNEAQIFLNHAASVKTCITEGSLNSKFPPIWRSEKQMKSIKSKERRCNSAKVRRKKIHPRQMLEKSRNIVIFQWNVRRVSRKGGSLKRRVRSHVVRREIKNCTPLWRGAHFQVKMCKTRQLRTTFWSSNVEKLYAAVARSAFWSQNAKTLRVSEHVLKFRCWKIANRCGEKHRCKSTCTKCLCFGTLFKVQMSKH